MKEHVKHWEKSTYRQDTRSHEMMNQTVDSERSIHELKKHQGSHLMNVMREGKAVVRYITVEEK